MIVARDAASLAVLESELTNAGIAIRTVSIAPGGQAEDDEITVGVTSEKQDRMLTALTRLRPSRGVRSAGLRS